MFKAISQAILKLQRPHVGGRASITDTTARGQDGGRFSISGGKAGCNYNLLNDSNLSFSGKIDRYGKDLGSTSINLGNPRNPTNITFNKNGTARINGRPMRQGQIYMTNDGGAAILTGKTLRVKTKEGYSINQTADSRRDCVNVDVNSGPRGVNSDGRLPTGVLGRTFDTDRQAHTNYSTNMNDHYKPDPIIFRGL